MWEREPTRRSCAAATPGACPSSSPCRRGRWCLQVKGPYRTYQISDASLFLLENGRLDRKEATFEGGAQALVFSLHACARVKLSCMPHGITSLPGLTNNTDALVMVAPARPESLQTNTTGVDSGARGNR